MAPFTTIIIIIIIINMYADDTVMYFTNIYTSDIAWVEKSMLFA